jgi:hypothetical protein
MRKSFPITWKEEHTCRIGRMMPKDQIYSHVLRIMFSIPLFSIGSIFLLASSAPCFGIEATPSITTDTSSWILSPYNSPDQKPGEMSVVVPDSGTKWTVTVSADSPYRGLSDRI